MPKDNECEFCGKKCKSARGVKMHQNGHCPILLKRDQPDITKEEAEKIKEKIEDDTPTEITEILDEIETVDEDDRAPNYSIIPIDGTQPDSSPEPAPTEPASAGPIDQPAQTSGDQEPKKDFPYLEVILVIIGVVLLIAGAFLLYRNSQQKKTNQHQHTQNQQIPQSTPEQWRQNHG